MAIQRKRSFRQRIFFSYLAVFTLFTIAILLFQYKREKEFRVAQLENTLENLVTLTHNFIRQNHVLHNENPGILDSLVAIYPESYERLTVIMADGTVFYDSEVSDVRTMENHLDRPEVQKSLYSGKGSSVRHSATTGENYYYYSRYYAAYFVRVSMVYNVQVKEFLKTEQFFLIFILVLFLIMWLIISLVTKQISKFVIQLQDLSVKAGRGELIEENQIFTDSELSTIKQQIVTIYNRLNKAKSDLTREKEKLFQHLNVLNEGIAFYTAKNEVILTNSLFVQHINILSEKSSVTLPDIFQIKELEPAIKFVRFHQLDKAFSNELPRFSFKLTKKEAVFEIRVIVFTDKGFEMVLSDISKIEKRRMIKQQLTANIAHELKTPVASLRGYLETILSAKDISADKKNYFIERAFLQSERLSELLDDVSLLNNIDEGGSLFEFKPIEIKQLVDDVIENQWSRLREKGISCTNEIGADVRVMGNDSLLSSIFLNLVENSIRYAGENITISIRNFHSDQARHYFSFSDTGTGIPEEHLPRIFERFYRIDEGRSRKTGGTGLGLSIVKNAIQLHKGEISVKNLPEGGLEFYFSLERAER
ncbi:MAG TPA: HAMP domain-containing sensor histidine kinase [Prolixibacteraceae bacterium]|nr:HAMP domain-containing sensor histidine kinase [Prolixibacteraceae bacterium]